MVETNPSIQLVFTARPVRKEVEKAAVALKAALGKPLGRRCILGR